MRGIELCALEERGHGRTSRNPTVSKSKRTFTLERLPSPRTRSDRAPQSEAETRHRRPCCGKPAMRFARRSERSLSRTWAVASSWRRILSATSASKSKVRGLSACVAVGAFFSDHVSISPFFWPRLRARARARRGNRDTREHRPPYAAGLRASHQRVRREDFVCRSHA